MGTGALAANIHEEAKATDEQEKSGFPLPPDGAYRKRRFDDEAGLS